MGNNTAEESIMEGDEELNSSFARQIDEISSKMLNEIPVKVPIVGFETMEERAKFTIFKLRVENDKLNESWLVFRRYTDFVRLHSKLKEEIPDIQISLPPKRWLRDNFETAFLEDRMKGLQALVDSILVQSSLVELPTVRKFFCLDEPPVYSDTAEETKSWFGMLEDSSVMLKHKLHEKDQEIDLLRAELALVTTQRDNIFKLARNCRHCSQKPTVISASFLNSPRSGTPILSSVVNLPSSSSSSDRSYNNSPRKVPLVGDIQLQLSPNKNRKGSVSSKTSTLSSAANSPGPSRNLNDNNNQNNTKVAGNSGNFNDDGANDLLQDKPSTNQNAKVEECN